MQNDWYKSFFTGVALDMWSNAMTPEITETEAGFLADVLELQPGSSVLDVPCGNGRHSIALAKRGYKVIGIDLAPQFIERAGAVAAAARVNPEFNCADMRELPPQAAFDAAFCFGNSFGYLDHAGTCVFLSAVAETLRTGARFVIETGIAAESILPKLQERSWTDVGDILFLSSRRYNVADSRLEIDYTFIRDGVRETRPAATYVYTVAEIRRMLEAVGLSVVSMYSTFDKRPYEFGSPRLLVVAQKR
jgi:SAM-dependent methyltransferase